MVVDRTRGTIAHHRFGELPGLLDGRDILARNNTRVLPARLVGHRESTGGKWEGLFLRDLGDETWEILATTRGRPAPGERVVVGRGLALELLSRGEGGRWIVRPSREGDADRAARPSPSWSVTGRPPCPPIFARARRPPGIGPGIRPSTPDRPGSVAAPTAGLHFSEDVFANLAARGIAWADLTLHVGIGTFRPIEAEAIDDHVMHAEWADLPADAADALNARRALGGRIVAVGTTSARTLETAAASGRLEPFTGPTGLFIRPGHVFRGLDALITNFHLPRSSLLVLVSALAGVELIRAAYAEAIRRRYRFFSYGDAMLIF